MKKSVLITGSSGFLGGHLVRSLSNDFEFQELHHTQLSQVQASQLRGQTLIHLAGIGSVPECEQNPLKAYEVNCALSLFLAELFFRSNPGGHFIFTSTGQVYDEKNDVPYTEASKLKPLNVYARAKLSAETGLQILADSLNGKLTILRLFNQTHKTQSPHFFLPSIYHQLLASSDAKVHIKVGNIDVNRDLSAIADFTSAIQALLFSDVQTQIQCFNLCSGTPKNLQDIAINLGRRLNKEIVFEIDPARLRGADRKLMYGKSDLFQKTYDWSPKSSSIEKFLDGFLADL